MLKLYYSIIDGALNDPLLGLKTAHWKLQMTMLITRVATMMSVQAFNTEGAIIFICFIETKVTAVLRIRINNVDS